MNKIKKYIVTTLMALAMVLPIIQPLAVHAEEINNNVVLFGTNIYENSKGDEIKDIFRFEFSVDEDVKKIAGYIDKTETYSRLNLMLYPDNMNNCSQFIPSISVSKGYVILDSCYFQRYENGELKKDLVGNDAFSYCTYQYLIHTAGGEYKTAQLTWSGIKVFDSLDTVQNYLKTGSTSGLVEPPKTGLDKEWYLKNIGYSVRAEDGGENEDATFIKFTWDTDNLQDGDLIEIRTHNWYRTLTGNQFSGFHDYITFENGVSAMNGSYEISQYEATNAWFKSLDNTPLVFKSFDTDTYYLRPYRNGVYGGWVRISMKRNPAIKGTPYVNNVEYGDFDEETGEFVIDSDRTQTEGGYGITQKGEPVVPDEYDGLNNVGTVITTAGDALKYFFSNITSIMGLFGQLPQLLNAVIGWLPSPLIVLICASVVVVIILRIFGR